MESMMCAEFVKRTGVDIEGAYLYLHSAGWDVYQALKSWYETCHPCTDGDRAESKKLARGISGASGNETLVLQARNAIAKDFVNNCLYRFNNYYLETPDSVFVLPDFSVYSDEFRKFIEKDLMEKSVMVSLETSNRLNWWCQNLSDPNRLWPLSTTGDGNCLLHAASLNIYGFHDRLLTLRQALHHFITYSPSTCAIKRRWKWHLTKINMQSGVDYSEEEWQKEWDNVVQIASAKKRQPHQQGIYEGLEEVHILTLANVLKRAIIVISETMLRDRYNQPLSPIHFGGIYLPLECEENSCSKAPLILTYDMAHFSALCFMDRQDLETPGTFYVPLVDSNGVLLPIQFSVDPGADFNWDNYSDSVLHTVEGDAKRQLGLLKTYLNVVDNANGTFANDELEDEIENRYMDLLQSTETDDLFNKKSKPSKQLEVLTKQFGSLGKSVGKTLRRNFGSLTRLAAKSRDKNEPSDSKIIYAEVRITKHPYQIELITNYLKFAGDKFLSQYVDDLEQRTSEETALKRQALKEGLVKCINTNCTSPATSLTSYMCKTCYKTQHERETANFKVDDAYHGVGKSIFYREPDARVYGPVRGRPTLRNDRTLYLSNSTFFYDTTPDNNGYISRENDKNSEKNNQTPEKFSEIPVPKPNNMSVRNTDINSNFDSKLNGSEDKFESEK